MRKARAEGKLGEDFDVLLDDLLGTEPQQRHEAQAAREAADMAAEIDADNMPFSLAPLDAVFSAARQSKRGQRPVAAEVGKVSAELAARIPSGFPNLNGWPILIDEDLIRKNDKLAQQRKLATDRGFVAVNDAILQSAAEIINSADSIEVGQARNDGTRTLVFRKKGAATVAATTSVRGAKKALAVVRLVQETESAALPLTELLAERQEPTPEAMSDTPPESAQPGGESQAAFSLAPRSLASVADTVLAAEIDPGNVPFSLAPRQKINAAQFLKPDAAPPVQEVKDIGLSGLDEKEALNVGREWLKQNAGALSSAMPEGFKLAAAGFGELSRVKIEDGESTVQHF